MDSAERPNGPTVPLVAPAQLLAKPQAVVVDLRTPAEFAVDHLPGAHNVPLLSDAGRSLVGLLYHQRSPEEALSQGAELVLRRVEDLVAEIGQCIGWQAPEADLRARVRAMTDEGLPALEAEVAGAPAEALPERPVVLHCWRGGLRSRSVVALLRSLGLEDAVGLDGGYRSYRTQVMAELDAFQAPPTFGLRGLTGVGKTLVLRELERQRPGWTVDLEGCAGHRSSLLGMVGLEPVTQKAFDSNLATRLRAGLPGPLVMEGESRKVGDVVIPKPLWDALQGATHLELTADLDVRLKVLMDDYLARPEARGQLRTQLEQVEGRMEGDFGLVQLLDEGREERVVELLLEHYYDPLYRRSERDKVYAASFDTRDPADAAEAIGAWIEARV